MPTTWIAQFFVWGVWGRPKKALNSRRLRHFFSRWRHRGRPAGSSQKRRLEGLLPCLWGRGWPRCGGGGMRCLPAARRGSWSRCLGSKSRSKGGKSQVQGQGSRRHQIKAPCRPQGKLAGSMLGHGGCPKPLASSEQWAVAPSWSKFRLFYLQRPPQRQRQLAPA